MGTSASTRALRALVLTAIAATLAPASAQAFAGAYVRGSGDTDKGPRYVRVRVVCPPATRSTPRPGDFSFCTGTVVLFRHGRVVGSAPFSVRTNDSHVERVLVRAGRKHLVPPRSTVRLTWRVTSHDGQGNVATRTGTVAATNRHGPA